MSRQQACLKDVQILSFRTVYITKRSRCSYQSGYMIVRQDEQTMIHLSELDMVIIESTAVYISTYLLAELSKAKVPVVVCDLEHNPTGQYLPLYGAYDSAKRALEQSEWQQDLKDALWQKIIISKVRNQALVLERFNHSENTMLFEYAEQVQLADASNREGHAAKVYFNALFGKNFTRDLECHVNAQLNYGYAILLAWTNREIAARGYLTQWGIAHRNDYNHFNLACDFMEPFRPVIDEYVIEHAEQNLDKKAKADLLDLFSRYYQTDDGRFMLSSILSRYVKTNIAVLCRRIPLDDYSGFDFIEE